MLKIHSYETMSANDGPGIRTVFFLQGCNFHCLYCHNPDTQDCLVSAKLMTDAEIIAILQKNLKYYANDGGVTFSGGEALLQAEQLLSTIKAIKKQLNISIVLDTNGSILQEKTKEVLQAVDLIIFDLKHIEEKKHLLLTGQSNKWTKQAIEWCEKQKKHFWVRYVLVPGFTDAKKDLEAWAEYIKSFKYVDKIEILPYHTLGVTKYQELGKNYQLFGVRPATKMDVNRAKKIMNLKK